ncbi:MAG: TIM barrel protein [Candidatus Hydrogenedentes bacterium]|nr:TIM barrel protein [Candidatus Hydrogenedentota bacterium]
MKQATRREFMLSAAAAAMAARVAGAQDSGKGKRKFTIALVGGAIGVQGTIRQQLDWATKYGFESIEPKHGELVGMSGGEINELKAEMDERGLQWAVTGAPVNIREQSDDAFATQLSGLEAPAKAWQAAGVTRVKSAVMSFSQDLNYLDNFRLHTDRIRRAGKVLDGYGLRFGLEYLGPKTLWTLGRHSFVHSMAETRELIAAAGQDNVALVLDSWHWYCARESVDDILALEGKDVISCDLNDAPAGVDIDAQIDNRRKLPATTGVIDDKGFLDALIQIGFDGSIMAEPFSDELYAMDDDEALKRTIDAMKKAFALVE